MEVRKLFFRISLLGLPLGIIIAFFILTDPYSIFFADEWAMRKVKLQTSNDYIFTNKFFEQHSVYHYDSYVFGNSRSYVFQANEWQNYLAPDAVIYKWGAPGESIHNIRKKLELIVNSGEHVDNALLVLDFRVLNNFRNTGSEFQNPTSIHHPATSDITWPRFYLSYFKYYMTDYMFVRHIDYTLTGNYKGYMKGYVPEPASKLVNDEDVESDAFRIHNQQSFQGYETSIRTDSALFFKSHVGEPSGRFAGKSLDEKLQPGDIDDLKAIMEIFRQQKTNYRIVLGPLLERAIINPENLAILNGVFGSQYVFNFTGENKYSVSISNFYDPVHFRIGIASDIMHRIYRPGSRVSSNP